jgi:hypothetical protein
MAAAVSGPAPHPHGSGRPLLLDVDGPDGPIRLHVDGGAARLAVPDPEHLIAAVAGVVPGGRVVLDRQVLGGASRDRWVAGLATATCALPPALEVPILELVVLGASVPGRATGQLLGTRSSRAAVADAVAGARSLAGRIGLGGWLDRPADRAPAHVQALADVARALVGAPQALVWRRPEWLGARGAQDVADIVEAERQRIAATAVEVVLGPPAPGRGSGMSARRGNGH